MVAPGLQVPRDEVQGPAQQSDSIRRSFLASNAFVALHQRTEVPVLYQIVTNRKTGRVRVVELPCDPRPQLRAGLFLL